MYGVAGFNPSTGTPDVVTGATTYTMSNLTPGTTYDVYIRSQCDDGSYATWTSTSFTTLANFPATLPYTCGFEDATENANWNFVNGTQANKWCVGGFVHNTGDSALYISSNNGANNDYIENSETTVWAYRDIVFDNSSEFALSFDWRCNGESNYDYLEVYMGAPVDVVAGNSTAPTGSQLLGRFNQNSAWNHESFTITSQYANTTQRLYFMWKNDPSVGNNPAAAIDNIEVVGLTCGSPYGLAVSNTTSNSATIHFIPASSSDTQWEMALLTPNDTIDPTSVIYLQDTTYSLTNLVSGTQYRVFVRTDCGGDYSAWVGPLAFVPGSYNMGVSGWDTLYSCGAAIYDNGGATGDYSNNIDAYLVVYPDQPGSFVQISGTLLAESIDRLTFYDGVGTANQLFQTNQSSNTLFTIPTITSTTGPLTIYFHSDVSVVYAGYELFTSCVSCVSPTLTVNNVTTTGATLDWSTFAGSQTSFEIVYGAPGINPDNETPITVSNATTYALTGLTPATNYVAYIHSDCGDGTYATWEMVSFTTDCNVVDAFPYTENFDAVTTVLPACWTSTGSNTNWEVTSTFHGSNVNAAHSGSKVMQFYQGGRNDVASLQLPTFDLTSLTNPTLSFWYTNDPWSSDVDELKVYYRTSPSDTWTQLADYTLGMSTWTFDSLALPSPSANYQIKFEGISNYGYGINLDDITISDGTGGSTVVNPTVATNAASSVGQTNATLNAIITNPDGVTVTAKGFEWKATMGGTYAPIAGTGTGNTFTADLTGLTPNTGYSFKAFITYNGTTVYGSEMTFTTLDQGQQTCPAPTNVAASNITENSADISWTQPDNTANSWDVQYKESGASAWNTVTTSNNPHTLTGLTANTSYDVQVIAHCTNGQTSDPSATITLTTVGINDYTLDNSVTVYPNPTTGVVQIKNEEWRMENMEVYDAYGKMLNVMSVNDHTANLDLGGYAKGTYFVRVTTERGVVTKRVVKN